MAEGRAERQAGFLCGILIAIIVIYSMYTYAPSWDSDATKKTAQQRDLEKIEEQKETIDKLQEKIDKLQENCAVDFRDRLVELFEKHTNIVNETLNKVPSGKHLQEIYSAQKEVARVFYNCMQLQENNERCKHDAESLDGQLK